MTLTKRIILANVGMAAICAASTMAQEAVTPQPVPAAQPPVVSAPLHFPAGPKWSSPEIAKVGDMLKGTWKSTAAVPGRDGASEAEIVMTVAPIVAQDIPDAMYVESARSDSMQAPYRRSLFQLYSYKGHVRLRTLEPITPEGRDTLNQLTGFWAYPEALPLLTSHAVKSADYIATLDVELEPFKQGGGFSGKTPYPYPNGANGAVEMTSELTLMPDALTIEFSARFVSSVADQNTFSPLSVYFCIGNGLGSAFYLGSDDAWLAAPNLSRGVAATVDTDNALHTYRIELSGSTIGSTINVYYDNAASPLLTSTVVHDVAVYGNSPQIGFGDSSTKDSGVSEWGFLWHNASCIPINAVPEPTTAALLIAGALVLGRRSLRRN